VVVERSGRLAYIGSPIKGMATIDGSSVGVEVRSSGSKVEDSVDRVDRDGARGKLELDALLIVVLRRGKGTPPADLAAAASRRLGLPVRVLRWRRDEDPEQELADALEQLLGELSPPRT
jgi:hypothetical protein